MVPSESSLLPASPILPSDGLLHIGTVPRLISESLSSQEPIPVAAVYPSAFEGVPDYELLKWKRPDLDVSFLFPDMTIQCSHKTLEAFLIQETPRMVYIKGFLTEADRKHLIEISEPGYEQSFVYQPENQGAAQDTSFRKSETVIPPRDEVIQCIEQRARLSQPWRRGMGFEAISVQRYLPGGFFAHHWDSFDTAPDPDRRSTFNVFLAGNCTGGGTHFPMLPFPHDPTLCDVIDCQSDLEGTVFRPIAGNAIYWENVDPSGARYQETFHAGLPVTEGSKIGLNIWTWSFPDRT